MNILFVCTGNTCRSPMAEGILNSMSKKKGLKIKAKSAGIAAFDGGPPAGNAVKAMEEIGIDINDHKSTTLHRDLVMESDLILTMSQSHKQAIVRNFPDFRDKVFTLIEYTYKEEGDIIDPFGGSLKTYQDTRDEIAHCIKEIVNGDLIRGQQS